VTASPDNTTATVGPSGSQAVLSGLSNATADTYSVAAVNAVGTGPPGSFGSAAPVLSGTLLDPAGHPLANDPVYLSDMTGLSTSPPLLATVTTDSSGNWSYTVPPFASLPAAIQTDATNNDGVLQIEADAYAKANGYPETASTFESVWVGTGQTAPASLPTPQSQPMTLVPEGPDNSAQVTSSNISATFASVNDPETTGGGTLDPSSGPPLDAYGFQSIGPDNNYNPYVAFDGTNLTNVTPQPFAVPATCQTTITYPFNGPKMSVIGEANNDANSTASFSYTKGSETSISVEYSADSGAHWGASGSTTMSANRSITTNFPTIGPGDARRALLNVNYTEEKKYYPDCISDPYPPYSNKWIWAWGIHYSTTNQPARYGTAGYLDGKNGSAPYCAIVHNHPGYRQHFDPGYGVTITWGHSSSYSTGATVVGVGLSTETTYSVSASVTYTAGKKTKYDHWTWGIYGNPYTSNPRTLRTYDKLAGSVNC